MFEAVLPASAEGTEVFEGKMEVLSLSALSSGESSSGGPAFCWAYNIPFADYVEEKLGDKQAAEALRAGGETRRCCGPRGGVGCTAVCAP